MHKRLSTLMLLCLSISACGPDNNINLANEVKPNIVVNVDSKSINNNENNSSSNSESSSSAEAKAQAESKIELPEADVKEATETALKQVVNDHLNAINEQNQENFIKTIHPGSPMLSNLTQILFNYGATDSKFDLQDIKVSSVSEGSATLIIESNYTFFNHNFQQYQTIESVDLVLLKKDDDKWKVFSVTPRNQ